jgi:sugar lactone lactonase YvrE
MKKSSFSYFSAFSLIFTLVFSSCGDKGGTIEPEEPKPIQPRAYTSVSTFAGSTTAVSGSIDGTGNDARFKSVKGVVQDSEGNFFVADGANNTIRKITPAGVVTTFAGTVGTFGNADGTGTAATFRVPAGLAIDASNSLYVADQSGHRIRKITPAGVVTNLAGSTLGSADGTGTNAQLDTPRGIVLDNAGNLFVASGNKIHKIVIATGVVTTFAGGGTGTNFDRQGTDAKFFGADGICIDKQNNLYVADGRSVRKITPTGLVTTIAGTNGDAGFRNGKGTDRTLFLQLVGIAIDEAGYLYVTDTHHGAVRRIAPDGTVSDFAGIAALPAESANTSIPYAPGDADGALMTARFRQPAFIHFGKDNILYLGEEGGHRVRKIQ